MRKPTDICLLCNERQATQSNSHLIPKHFGQGIFYGTTPKHGILMDKTGNVRKIQDILKENYILCPVCEKGISVFESYCKLRLERFNDQSFFHQFRKFKKGSLEFFECLQIDIRLFNLLIYSIVWRVSVSQNYGCLKFKLPDEEEEKLRLILNEYISPSQNELFGRLDKMNSLPSHKHILFRPKKKLRPPQSMLSVSSINEYTHMLHLVDYVLIYATGKSELDTIPEINNNTLNRFVRVGLTEPEHWREFNFNLLKKWKN